MEEQKPKVDEFATGYNTTGEEDTYKDNKVPPITANSIQIIERQIEELQGVLAYINRKWAKKRNLTISMFEDTLRIANLLSINYDQQKAKIDALTPKVEVKDEAPISDQAGSGTQETATVST